LPATAVRGFFSPFEIRKLRQRSMVFGVAPKDFGHRKERYDHEG
jgi:hypothetical protein